MKRILLILLVVLLGSCKSAQVGLNATNVYIPDVGHTQTYGPYIGAPVGPVYTYGVYGVNNGTVTVGVNVPLFNLKKKDTIK